MSSQEYYGNDKYPNHGSQSPMPPYSQYPPYSAYPQGASSQTTPPGHGTEYPQNGYQYPPQDYYGGYQQQQPPPPPPYYQHEQLAVPAPAQFPYPYSYQPPESGYPPDTIPGTEAPTDRGALGALAGGAAGAYAGHQVHHGILGTIGGAITGSLAEDAMKHKNHKQKDKKEKKKSKWGFHRRSSSSSSSSSSDSEKDDAKPAPSPAPASPRGNFAASSVDIALHGNNELVASCRAISGRNCASRLPLNSVLENRFGHFRWNRDGNFGASARNAHLNGGGRVLEAELADGRGGWRRDRVRLDERITNRDGVLVFLD